MKRLVLAAIIVAVFSMPARAATRADVQSVLDEVYAAYPGWAASYQYGVWDCSEMSAYLYDAFKDRGFYVNYCNSRKLWHCWIEISPEEHSREAWIVEATKLRIEDDRTVYYSCRDVRYNIRMRADEVDYWNSPFLVESRPPPGVGASGGVKRDEAPSPASKF